MSASVDRGRVGKTWRLAETLLDYLPQARQASSVLGALPGLAVSRNVPCDVCTARGRLNAKQQPCVGCPPRIGPAKHSSLRPRHGCHPCPVCEGTGWRPRRKSDPEYDSYAGIPIPPAAKADDISIGAMREAMQAERERPEIRVAALARATRAVDLAERPESDRFAWEEAWDRMCATGSYAELVVALEVQRMREEERYRIVWHVVVMAEPITLSEKRSSFLNESMVDLASRMPEQIRVPRYLRADVIAGARKKSLWHGRSPAHARERRERDAEICERRFGQEQAKVSLLQRDYGLSRQQVHKILAAGREEEASQNAA